MAELHLLVPGRLDQATGGYRYGLRIVERAAAHGRPIIVHELAGRYPACDSAAHAAAREALSRLPAGALAVIDGLALPAFYPLLAGAAPPVVALVHHPLGLETGLAPEVTRQWLADEAAALRHVRGIIVTSLRTVDDLRAMGVDVTRIAVVLPGTDPPPFGPTRRDPRLLLTVASLLPRKGHVALLLALAGLKHLPWRLICVGSLTRDAPQARRVKRAARDLGLGARVRFAGELSGQRLARAYARAGVFVLASRHEGYGMVLAEAMTWRLPIVATRAGAIPQTVPRVAGMLVHPHDRQALRRALRRMLASAATRQRYGAGAAAAARRLPDWDDSARRFVDAAVRLAAT